MSYLIISDVHGNADALFAVLEDAKKHGNIEKVWCLGDIAGYGAEADACITIVREIGCVCIKGNHDMAVSGELDTVDFNDAAAAAAAWQKGHVSMTDRQWLKRLPLTLEIGDFTLVHGSPRDPIWEYINGPREAAANMALFRTNYCFVGHTHCPTCFVQRGQRIEQRLLTPGQPVKLTGKTLINPGSVGQPRDRDPRASYLLYDHDNGQITNWRVRYDVRSAQYRIRHEGLPDILARRLQFGR